MTLPILSADDPLAVAATQAIHTGDIAALQQLLHDNPQLATARIGDNSQARSLLHVVTDWPGHFPPSCRHRRCARSGGDRRQQPLRWPPHRDPAALGGQQRRRRRPRRLARRRRGARGRSRAGIQCGPLPRPGQCGVVRRRRRPGPSGEDPRRRGRCRGGAAGARGVGGPQGDDPGDPQHHHDRPAQLGTPQHGADRVGSRRRARVGEPDCGASCAAVTAAISAAISPGR